ncbi:uncharacterized protein PHALS_14451 [Plasmopara halstedii]|uniref:Uncharacterized protein n=1 Tax=Plasmopara halstedii TaxID=4781 RepID=A0A0P1AU56_PLAHL|nr:uncharacterized protein PHALS_14451 [Plasmopara halstedii]CEG44193.1 hypothetical protein PHALS_14451 [Plasmopara halstedii]|eukprot:XP_024580562.1 hypothetical protein PHALS_14451 [Plasmopara halstedii]
MIGVYSCEQDFLSGYDNKGDVLRSPIQTTDGYESRLEMLEPAIINNGLYCHDGIVQL